MARSRKSSRSTEIKSQGEVNPNPAPVKTPFDPLVSDPDRPGHINRPGHVNFDPPGHVNSGPPGHINRPGHVNFDPPGHVNSGPPGHINRPGHVNFDPPGHVNSGPPGHANEPGHANFDPPGHVNSGPPGHANEPGHANFDPGHANSGPPGHANEPGHANFDPGHANSGPPGHANEPGHANFNRPDLDGEKFKLTLPGDKTIALSYQSLMKAPNGQLQITLTGQRSIFLSVKQPPTMTKQVRTSQLQRQPARLSPSSRSQYNKRSQANPSAQIRKITLRSQGKGMASGGNFRLTLPGNKVTTLSYQRVMKAPNGQLRITLPGQRIMVLSIRQA